MFSHASHHRGVAWWVVVVAVAVVIIAGVLVEVASNSGDDDTNAGDDGGNNLCPSYCLGFVELECGSNKLVGGCFGVWDCEAGVVNECEE